MAVVKMTHTQLAAHEITKFCQWMVAFPDSDALIFVAFANFHTRMVDMVGFALLPFIFFARIPFLNRLNSTSVDF